MIILLAIFLGTIVSACIRIAYTRGHKGAYHHGWLRGYQDGQQARANTFICNCAVCDMHRKTLERGRRGNRA